MLVRFQLPPPKNIMKKTFKDFCQYCGELSLGNSTYCGWRGLYKNKKKGQKIMTYLNFYQKCYQLKIIDYIINLQTGFYGYKIWCCYCHKDTLHKYTNNFKNQFFSKWILWTLENQKFKEPICDWCQGWAHRDPFVHFEGNPLNKLRLIHNDF